MTSALVIAIACNFLSNNDHASSFYGIAYAQSPPGIGGGSDLGSPGDNSTGLPGDNSTDPGNISGGSGTDLGPPGANSTDLGAAPGGPSDLSMPGDNMTGPGALPDAGNVTTMPSTQSDQGAKSSAVPEFGPMVSVMLVLSIVSIVIFSARTRLRF